VRDGVDDFYLDKMLSDQAQSPAGTACGRFGTGKLDDAGLDITGNLDLARRFFPCLALQSPDRTHFTTADAKAFERAWSHSGRQTDFAVLERGTGRPFV